jgi:hypothetical protein
LLPTLSVLQHLKLSSDVMVARSIREREHPAALV